MNNLLVSLRCSSTGTNKSSPDLTDVVSEKTIMTSNDHSVDDRKAERIVITFGLILLLSQAMYMVGRPSPL